MSKNIAAAVSSTNRLEQSMGFAHNSLLDVFLFETIGSLSPSKQNADTLATGLIQFMPNTARVLGTSVDRLRNMSFDDQLVYVRKYFDQNGYTKKVRSSNDPLDCYLAVFFPAAIGKPDSFVIQTSKLSPSLIAKQNPVFDLDKNKLITKSEIRKKYTSTVNIFRKKVGIPPRLNFTQGVLPFVAVGGLLLLFSILK